MFSNPIQLIHHRGEVALILAPGQNMIWMGPDQARATADALSKLAVVAEFWTPDEPPDNNPTPEPAPQPAPQGAAS